ncbi:MAG: enolase C-terminal domain-like protein [Azospirillaceae bacterium]
MKITKVRPILADRFLFVLVETDAGFTGVGESGAWGHLPASATAIQTFSEYLVGRDAGEIEQHWNTMHRFGHFRGAAICGAISAIDIALWDIKGQALGVPIHALLGGPTRRRARLYAHVKAPTRERVVEIALQRKAMGFTAIGHLNPFLDEDRERPYFRSHARKIDDGVRVVAELRDALGPDVDLCVEIHRRLTPPEAIVFAHEIAPFRPMFYEDPIRPGSAEAMGRVADAISLPIATGERFFSLEEFQIHISRGALAYARVSISLCGGITGARKVAALAEAFDVAIVPHNPLSPISLAAALHLDAAIPNFAIQEYPLTGDSAGGDEGAPHLRGWHLVDRAFEVEDGFVAIPGEAGLGLRLAAGCEQAPVVARDIRMRSHLDGHVVDQ